MALQGDAIGTAAQVLDALRAARIDTALIHAQGIALRGSAVAEDYIRRQLRWSGPAILTPPDATRGWTDLLSPDGHLRAAALGHLAGPAPGRFLLAVLMRRLNDWAGPVRLAALPAIRRCVAASDPVLVVEVGLHLLGESRSWGRNRAARDVFVGILLDEAMQPGMLRYMQSPAARPGVLAELLISPDFDGMLPDLAYHAVVPGIRGAAVKTLTRGAFVSVASRKMVRVDLAHQPIRFEQRLTLQSREIHCPPASEADVLDFATDRSAMVRRAVLDGLEQRDPVLKRAVAEKLRDDSWPSIRERAAFILRN